MPDRKRRPPSGKIPPGTPHPTKAYTVRGYDGRWISRKAFLAAKRKRDNSTAKLTAKPKSQKPKGGSLVKRGSSAVTKVSNKVGNLLKIRKGDKGIVRGIKDTYKLGKDTRKSANALYKAGKITREIHDKLVKGSKEFVKGTVESGKATRRAYERLKPGGKIVKSKGSKLAKYRKAALKIVKSPGGKIVRSPSGKVVRSPSGKLVKTTPNKGGKLTTKRTPQYKTDAKKTAQNTAQQTKDSARKKSRWDKARTKQQKAASGSFNVKEEWNPKTKKWETRYGQGTTKPKQKGPFTKGKEFVKETAPKVKKGATKVLNKIRNIPGAKKVGKGLVSGGRLGGKALRVLEPLENLAGGVRTTANLVQRIRKKPLIAGKENLGGATTQFERDRIKAQNAYLKKHGSLKGFNKATSRWNKKKTDNKTTTTKKTTTTPTTSTKSQLDKNIDNAKGWNKRQLQKEKDYQSKFGKQPRTWTKGYGAESTKPSEGDFKSTNKNKSSGSTVHTRHYKTGERLGVMGRSQRRAYDKEAAGRTFESEVAKYAKSSGHGKSHLRETLYKSSVRKKKKKNRK